MDRANILSSVQPPERVKILVEVSHTSEHDVRTGIQAVVRGLLAGLCQVGANFQTVRWSGWQNDFVPVERSRNHGLGIGDLNERRASLDRTRATWLLLPEVIYGPRLLRMIGRARKRGIWIAAVFHDAIPVIHPELVRREARKFHSAYMSGLSELDLIIAVSETAAEQFREFAEERSGHIPPISICPSAGELVGEKQAAPKANTPRDTINILCVSTLEPRKNHKTLLQAFELASSVVSHPQLSLHLVGTRYKDADHVLELVNKAVSRCPNIIWHGKVTDQQLAQLYRDCDFTIYPSVIEGFGLAISQSLWNRRPCICANFGAMAEIADEGGCLTLDVRNTIELRDAIIALATDPDLRHRLVQEIESRPAKTWRAYAAEICGLLQPVDRPNALQLT